MGKADNTTYHFEGEVLLVYLMNASEGFTGGIAIKKPRIRELFGRSFVVGEVPADINDWASGLKTAVAVDQIVHFLEFPDEKEYFQRVSSISCSGGLVS
jgi:hypothetical protein